LTAGAGLIAIGLLLLYQCVRKGHEARLAAGLEVSQCGRVQEGLLKITGQVASAAVISSPLMELPCVITQTEAAIFRKRASKKKWNKFFSATQNVPFYVEDSTGRLWVDPSEAELFLLADVEFSTEKKWKPKPKQLTRFGEMELSEGGTGVVVGRDDVWIVTWDEGDLCDPRAVIGNGFMQSEFVNALEDAGLA